MSLTDFIPGGIQAKIIAGLVCLTLVGAAIFYVQNLRSNLAIERANNAKLIDDIAAFKQKQKVTDAAIEAMRSINHDIEVKWSIIDVGQVEFAVATKKKVETVVETLKAAPTDPAVIAKAETDLNMITRANLRCTEIATGSPADAFEKKDPKLLEACPELLK